MHDAASVQTSLHRAPIRLDVPGEPVAQHRPRFRTAGKDERGHVYSDQYAEKELWQASTRILWAERPPLAGPLSLRCIFRFRLPRKHLKRYLAGERIYLQKAPPVTAYVKWVEDSLNVIAWKDDLQIEESHYLKEYCLPGEERTSIEIFPLSAETGWLLPDPIPGGASRVFELPGAPLAQERPLFFSNRAGKRHALNPQKREHNCVQLYARLNLPIEAPIRGPIRVCSIFHLPVPAEYMPLLKINPQIYVQDKPDLSNYEKWLEYCLEGIVWEKSAQIEEIYCRRQYCAPGREHTRFSVTKLEESEGRINLRGKKSE